MCQKMAMRNDGYISGAWTGRMSEDNARAVCVLEEEGRGRAREDQVRLSLRLSADAVHTDGRGPRAPARSCRVVTQRILSR